MGKTWKNMVSGSDFPLNPVNEAPESAQDSRFVHAKARFAAIYDQAPPDPISRRAQVQLTKK